MTLRILHLCQPTDAGTAVVVRELVRAGVLAGDDVTVGCPSGGDLADWVRAAGARWVEVPMTRAPSARNAALARQARRLYRDVDVVHLHSSTAGAVGRLATVGRRRSEGPRIFFTPHGWSWYVGGRLAPAYRRFERWAARRTDVVVVVSAEERAAGRAVLPAGTRIEVVENGVDADAYRPDGAHAPRGSAPLIVQVGRLSRQKGQDRSIRALAALPDPSTRLRLVGDGPDAAALADLAAELRVADRVEFVGSADPRPHLRAADLVVLPSRWEGMSLALLEAMATGVAVVATDCGDSAAVLGDAGVVISDRDDRRVTDRLADEITHLLTNPDERRRLGRLARETVEDRYRLSTTVERYVDLWRTT